MERSWAIKLDAVTRLYGANKVVSDISFTVNKGAIHGFLGPNGAGKTTTMKMIAGVIPPSSGNVEVSSHNIGVLLENPPLFDEMIVEDYLVYICQIHKIPKKNISKYVLEAIEKLELQSVSRRLIGNLSKGFRQRVGVAQAIVFKPEIVVLDEPTVGLDPASVTHMRSCIKEIAKDHTVLVSSHLLHEMEILCSDITIIQKGSIIASGTVDEVKKLAVGDQILKIEISKDGDLKQLLNDDELIFSIELSKQTNQSKEYLIHAKSGVEVRPFIYEKIKNSNVQLFHFERIELDLETAFLDLLGKEK
jgi:ABC-2 type transport system ATP-binding protein